ncbi:FAD-dependent oxidoreductase [Lederbergia sp. NSJ-179]|uniref:FAD-dependent oxidoreductase n=1 Tax=Lederbergia sp. NSJ-179 TaxID=2931402 RepID=UPI001FD3B0C7|nr:FAD-dependent oxidoreductase [Lederbergia sp. NSJ-179]MCJ7842735.1 FAD-dependent oxidoreductase [Lederbergia sp. NSJ-179]
MNKQELSANIVIVGGSLGGCAAALAACKLGFRVIMTEETKWIGGQLTNQAVPPDEHRWIEQFGCTRSYRSFRKNVRQYYRHHFPLSEEARKVTFLNPGNASVSRISHEPRVALAVLRGMLAPYLHSGKLTIMEETRIKSAETDGDTVSAVEVENLCTQRNFVLTADYFLDATDMGDVLPLAKVEYVTGAESQKDTGEPHALVGEADPMEMQAITHCFAIDYVEGEDFTITKPKDYEFWRQYQAPFWPNKQLDWTGVSPITLDPVTYGFFKEEDKFSLWEYRRLVDQSNFLEGLYDSDISLINWPQNDYWLGSIIDVSEEERKKHLEGAKQLSLSLLYWLQTEAPRPNGKQGYPGLRLRPDVVGTEDGLAMFPYIRESRRLKAEFTVLEQHVSTAVRGEAGAEVFKDSVGIGSYRIDLHPSTGLRSFIDISSLPFQIPLGSLIPVRINNLLPACKNLGVTHITNGCYRLHPVEWNIGEVSGYLAAYCLRNKLEPRQVRDDEKLLKDFQMLLVSEGIELEWPSIGPV